MLQAVRTIDEYKIVHGHLKHTTLVIVAKMLTFIDFGF